MAYSLSRVERETIIGFNAAEDTAELYTAAPVWIRKMDKLAELEPEQFKLEQAEKYQGEVIAKRYTLPKQVISIRTKGEALTPIRCNHHFWRERYSLGVVLITFLNT